MTFFYVLADALSIYVHSTQERNLRPQIAAHDTRAINGLKTLKGLQEKARSINTLFGAIIKESQNGSFQVKNPDMVQLLQKASEGMAGFDVEKVTYSKAETDELTKRLERTYHQLEVEMKTLISQTQESIFQRNLLQQERLRHVNAIKDIGHKRRNHSSGR